MSSRTPKYIPPFFFTDSEYTYLSMFWFAKFFTDHSKLEIISHKWMYFQWRFSNNVNWQCPQQAFTINTSSNVGCRLTSHKSTPILIIKIPNEKHFVFSRNTSYKVLRSQPYKIHAWAEEKCVFHLTFKTWITPRPGSSLLPADILRSSGDGSGRQVLTIHRGTLGDIPGSWLWSSLGITARI